MPEKPVTLRILPDGKVWMMGGSDLKLEAVEIKTPHGVLIDREPLLNSFRETIKDCKKWMEEVENDEETLPYARQAFCSFVEAKLRLCGEPIAAEAEQ